jgi:predicted transcriptional regulator
MQLKEYLSILQEKDLIKYQGSERTSFITTEKGKHFLNTYNKINKMIATIRRE